MDRIKEDEFKKNFIILGKVTENGQCCLVNPQLKTTDFMATQSPKNPSPINDNNERSKSC